MSKWSGTRRTSRVKLLTTVFFFYLKTVFLIVVLNSCRKTSFQLYFCDS